MFKTKFDTPIRALAIISKPCGQSPQELKRRGRKERRGPQRKGKMDNADGFVRVNAL